MHIVLLKSPDFILKFTRCDNQGLPGYIAILIYIYYMALVGAGQGSCPNCHVVTLDPEKILRIVHEVLMENHPKAICEIWEDMKISYSSIHSIITEHLWLRTVPVKFVLNVGSADKKDTRDSVGQHTGCDKNDKAIFKTLRKPPRRSRPNVWQNSMQLLCSTYPVMANTMIHVTHDSFKHCSK